VFALFKTVVWIVDRVKQDALARLLLENVTSTSGDEKLDEKLTALTLQSSMNDCVFQLCILLCNLTDCSVPPPSSEDNAWWDRPGTHHRQSVRSFNHSFYQTFNYRLDRSPKRCLRRYGSGGGPVSVDTSIRLTGGLPVVIFPIVI
jgi:hypothetical protein